MAFDIRNNHEEQGGRPFWGSRAELIVLLVSVLVAAVVWFMYNLSQEYSVFLDYPVNIESNLPGYEPHAVADQRFIIRGKAAGYYIVWRKSLSEKEPLTLKVDGRYMVHGVDSSDRFMIETRYLRRELSSVLGNDVDIEYLVSDSLTFHLTPMASKKVPVRPIAFIECAQQFTMTSSVTLSPDSVYITGSRSLISATDEVLTERINKMDVDANLAGMVALSPIRDVALSVTTVMYSADVSRYVEETVPVAVSIRNLPPDTKAVVMPDHVDLTFRRCYPVTKEIRSDEFRLVIDYDSFVKSTSPYTIPVMESTPSGVFSCVMKPEVVECIILER